MMLHSNHRCGACNGDVLRFVLLVLAVALLHRSSAHVDLEEERTLAIVKPDGVSGNYANLIRNIILKSSFSIYRELTLQLDEDTVRGFYAEHSTKSFFPSLVKYMTSGPVLIMVLQKVDAISAWRALIGPTDARKAKITHPDSIRAMCGIDLERNCVHGSDSHESAAREISFFFAKTFPGCDCNEKRLKRKEQFFKEQAEKEINSSAGCGPLIPVVDSRKGAGEETSKKNIRATSKSPKKKRGRPKGSKNKKNNKREKDKKKGNNGLEEDDSDSDSDDDLNDEIEVLNQLGLNMDSAKISEYEKFVGASHKAGW